MFFVDETFRAEIERGNLGEFVVEIEVFDFANFFCRSSRR